jgi:hypothetical protein
MGSAEIGQVESSMTPRSSHAADETAKQLHEPVILIHYPPWRSMSHWDAGPDY